jgi:signal transduction histidine kinase
VELHKGKIWVESPIKDGGGSRFCFAIPISRKLDSVSPELDNLYGCELKTAGG